MISEKYMVICPYCSRKFLVKYRGLNQKVACPKCNNLIMLDWGELEDDM